MSEREIKLWSRHFTNHVYYYKNNNKKYKSYTFIKLEKILISDIRLNAFYLLSIMYFKPATHFRKIIVVAFSIFLLSTHSLLGEERVL